MINRIRDWLSDRFLIAAGRIAPPGREGKVSIWVSIRFNTADLSSDQADEILAEAYRQIVTMCQQRERLNEIEYLSPKGDR